MATVIVKINKKTGNFEIDIDGVKGSSCTDISDFLAQNMDITKEHISAMIDDIYRASQGNDYQETTWLP